MAQKGFTIAANCCVGWFALYEQCRMLALHNIKCDSFDRHHFTSKCTEIDCAVIIVDRWLQWDSFRAGTLNTSFRINSFVVLRKKNQTFVSYTEKLWNQVALE